MACRASRDAHGTQFIIPESKPGKTAGGQPFPGSAELAVWWARRFRNRRDETLLIRQENKHNKVDLIELTLAQAYDLHHAIGCAILDT